MTGSRTAAEQNEGIAVLDKGRADLPKLVKEGPFCQVVVRGVRVKAAGQGPIAPGPSWLLPRMAFCAHSTACSCCPLMQQAHVYSHAELEAALIAEAGERLLDSHSALHRVHRARELGHHAVSGGVGDAPALFDDQAVSHCAMRREGRNVRPRPSFMRRWVLAQSAARMAASRGSSRWCRDGMYSPAPPSGAQSCVGSKEASRDGP